MRANALIVPFHMDFSLCVAYRLARACRLFLTSLFQACVGGGVSFLRGVWACLVVEALSLGVSLPSRTGEGSFGFSACMVNRRAAIGVAARARFPNLKKAAGLPVQRPRCPYGLR